MSASLEGSSLLSCSEVSVTVHGDDTKKEFHAAKQLKRVIEASLLPKDEGTFSLHSSVTMFGQRRRDLDIFLLARFPRGLVRTVDTLLPDSSRGHERVAFYNVVAAIEVKDQSPEGVRFQGTDAYVRYSDGWSNATSQSEEQKTEAFKYLKRNLSWSPFVCNLLWFRNLTKADLPSFDHNFLAGDVTLDDILGKLCYAKPPYLHPQKEVRLHFYCMKVANASLLTQQEDDLFSHFENYKNRAGALTRKRLERITQEKLLRDQLYAKSIGERLVLIRGRAGTGKTIKLLHIAYDLCMHQGNRVLILTYNRMLVSDLQRMMALAEVSSDLDSATVEIDTVHRFIRRLLDHFQIPYDKDTFLKEYETLKSALLLKLSAGGCSAEPLGQPDQLRWSGANWDKVLIDEGQDWPEDEREILFRLFNPKNFIVACGTGQFVRSTIPANWTKDVEFHKPIVYERRSLRQKRNLCEFQRMYAEAFGLTWDLEPSEELTGGQVIVVLGGYSKELHERLDQKCRADGNGAYEYMFVVPPSLTVGDGGIKRFALTDRFSSWDIKIWDGVNWENRTEYPTDIDEHRVVPYESVRGLEGWIVTCMDLDDFVSYKYKFPYIVDGPLATSEGQLTLGLKSEEERVRELVHEWVLIALTRAIDTIVITVKSTSSSFSQKLLEIAHQCEDFVEIVDGDQPAAPCDSPYPAKQVQAEHKDRPESNDTPPRITTNRIATERKPIRQPDTTTRRSSVAKEKLAQNEGRHAFASSHPHRDTGPGAPKEPVLPPSEASVVAFRQGDIVEAPHHGVGTVLQDAVLTLLPTLGRRYQSVKVQFGGSIVTIMAELAGLKHVNDRDK